MQEERKSRGHVCRPDSSRQFHNHWLMHNYFLKIFSFPIKCIGGYLYGCCQQSMEGSAWLVGWISSLYRNLSPLSLFPSVWVCSRVQDSQRFMSVTLSKTDISLTTPRTSTRMHVHTHSTLSHTLLPSPFLSPLCSLVHKHVRNGIHSRQRAKQRIESTPS